MLARLPTLVFKLTLALFVCLALLVPQAFAQTTPKIENLSGANYNPQLHTQYLIDGIGVGLISAVGGLCMTDNQVCYAKVYSKNSAGQMTATPVAYSGGSDMGAIGSVSNVMVALYQTPPVSTKEYVADLGRNLGIAPKEAYAQVGGSGETILKPVLKLWQLSRNVAYGGFIIIFVVAGLMIMFGRKADSHAHDAITAQQALPGLVMGLILVTLSYFIASVIVDMAFVGVRLMAEFFIATGTPNLYGDLRDVASRSNLFELYGIAGSKWSENGSDVFKAVENTLYSFGPNANILITAIIAATIAGVAGLIFMGPGGAALAGVGGLVVGGGAGTSGVGGNQIVAGLASIIVPLILLVALLVQLFKLAFALVSAYIQILVSTVLGPFIIMMSAIPGRGAAVSNWLRNLIASALMFPAVIGAFFFAGLILGLPASDWSNVTLPLFGGLSVELVRLIIAYGILLGTPAIPNLVKKAVGAQGFEGLTQDAVGGFQAGAGVLGSGWNRGYSGMMKATGWDNAQAAMHKRHIERLAEEATSHDSRKGRALDLAAGLGGAKH